jgi:hypothetical protein
MAIHATSERPSCYFVAGRSDASLKASSLLTNKPSGMPSIVSQPIKSIAFATLNHALPAIGGSKVRKKSSVRRLNHIGEYSCWELSHQ